MNNKLIMIIAIFTVIISSCDSNPINSENEAPSSYFYYPENNTQLLYGKNDSVMFSVYDLDGYITKIEFHFDDEIIWQKTNDISLFQIVYLDSNLLKIGKHNITIRVTDEKGKTNSNKIDIEVVNNTPDSYLSCKIESPKNNSSHNIVNETLVEVYAKDSLNSIEYVKLFIDNVLYKTYYNAQMPCKFYVEKNFLSLGKHTIVAVAKNKSNFEAKDSISIFINDDKWYYGNFNFTSKTYSLVLLTSYLVDSINYNGSISYYSDNEIIIKYRENKSEIFKINQNGTFESEGNWYDEASKKGGFVNSDSLTFYLKSAGYRSTTHISVTGKRFYPK